MLHRAILGSVERFVGILIEEHEAKFPLWLAPVQAVVLNITDKQAEFAQKVQKNLISEGFKVELDLRNEKVGYKIREHIIQRVPYMLVVGDRELETNTVAVRTRSGEDLGAMSIEDLVNRFSSEIACRGHAVRKDKDL
jgi:threonyl-tRNA synthetase